MGWIEGIVEGQIMGKILYGATMILAGIVIIYFTGNIVYSFLGCLLIGFVFNAKNFFSKKKEDQNKEDLSDYMLSPREYLNNFNKLREYVNSDKNYYDDYEYRVTDSIFIDTENNIWSLELETHNWYKYEGSNWIKAEPKNDMIIISKNQILE